MDQLNQLKVGNRYTIVKMGDMGFPFALKIELVELKIEPWAQYQETFLLIFKEKGKRKLRALRFFPRSEFLVYENWHDADTNIFVSTETTPLGTLVRKSLRSCDNEYLLRARRSVKETPLIESIRTNENNSNSLIATKEASS